ncbi:MAG TPA: O-antigen ligase family protein [Natronosporangium sp.]|nr:O-antigen ligase family protein [Natronosporangium sp.]
MTTAFPVDFEPSALGGQLYRTRRRMSYVDSSTVVMLMVCVLLLLPAQLVVPAMSSFGKPAILVSLLLAVWWLAARLHPRLTMTGPQPIRWAVLMFVLAALASYAAGHSRGLPSLEASGADAALLATTAMVGVMLMGADGIANRERLDAVTRLIVWCGAVMAAIGYTQSFLGIDPTNYLVLPGMTLHGELTGFRPRGEGFFQVASTTAHYIEFSAVMAIILPFAIHWARFGATRLRRQLAGLAAIGIAAIIPLTLSRTGIVALAIGMAIMFWAWPWRLRYQMLLAGAGLSAGFLVLQPGLLGTLRSIFLAFSDDPSIQGRLDDYPVVAEYFADRPWFGRGIGTFIPELYVLLDNQWLGTLVTHGLVGVAALAGLHLTAAALTVIAYRRASTAADRHLCFALLSTQAIAVVCGFTFDTHAFDTFALLVALLTGFAGAMWRLTHPARMVRTATTSMLFRREEA